MNDHGHETIDIWAPYYAPLPQRPKSKYTGARLHFEKKFQRMDDMLTHGPIGPRILFVAAPKVISS